MASDKRDLSDISSYEGKINTGKNLYEFPPLFKKDSRGKIREWNSYVRLVKDPSSTVLEKTSKIDWSLLINDQLPICEKYISGEKELPPHSVGQYWFITGERDGKRTRHPPSYGETKNIGRANERNALQTAIILVRNEFLKKRKQGFSESLKMKENERNPRYFPMLPKKYKEDYEKIIYPCYIQPKLDGTRVVAYLARYNGDANGQSEVVLYSRELKNIVGKDLICRQLKPILEYLYDDDADESAYIDFEFYEYGKKLQEISGIMRREKGGSLQAWIFDVFYPSKLTNITFAERTKCVEKFFKYFENLKVKIKVKNTKTKKTKIVTKKRKIKTINFTFDKKKIVGLYKSWLDCLKKIDGRIDDIEKKKIYKKEKGVRSLKHAQDIYKKLVAFEPPNNMRRLKIQIIGNLVQVPTILVKNRTEEEYMYWAFVSNNFEGTIVRNVDGIYRASNVSKSSYLRSPDVQKRKQLFSEEYPIYSFTEGKKGREKGALIWVFKIGDKIVKATPKNVTINERKKMFTKFCKDKKLFDREYKGKLITVEYEDLSKDNIPQRLKAIGLRPYK